MFSLIKNGVKITDARQTVATELGLRAGSTIWNWQRQLKMNPPITTIANVNHNTVISRQNTVTAGIGSMKNQLGTVFTSLVSKDGKYTAKEAGAISQVSSNLLGLARFELEVHKYADRTAKHNVIKGLL